MQVNSAVQHVLKHVSHSSTSPKDLANLKDGIVAGIRDTLGSPVATGLPMRHNTPLNSTDVTSDSLKDELNTLLPSPIPFALPEEVDKAHEFLETSEEGRNLLVCMLMNIRGRKTKY